MPHSIDKIFIEKEILEQDLKNFLEDREVKYLTILEDGFNSVKEILKDNRFIPMENDYCYDKEINSCWLGLCEDNFKYINSISSYSDYEESCGRGGLKGILLLQELLIIGLLSLLGDELKKVLEELIILGANSVSILKDEQIIAQKVVNHL